MARKGRRHTGKKLEPPLPEAKDKPVIPKYFGMIRGGGYIKGEEGREVLPGPMPRSGEAPKAVNVRQLLKQEPPFPGPAPEPEKIPLLVRAARYLAGFFTKEEERPEPMPRVGALQKTVEVSHTQQDERPFPDHAPKPEKVPKAVEVRDTEKQEPSFPDPAPMLGRMPKAVEVGETKKQEPSFPDPAPMLGKMQKAIEVRQSTEQAPQFPSPAPEPEKLPLLVKATRYLASVFGKAEEEQEPMPRMGELKKTIKVSHTQQDERPFPDPKPRLEGMPKAVEMGDRQEQEPSFPDPAPILGKMPKAIGIKPSVEKEHQFPSPAPEPEKIPLVIRAARYFSAVLGVEPERPEAMPVVPELNFPALYTRFPTMKTVTKTTDGAGEITVAYSRSFATIPGVVISVKDPDNVFGTIFSTTLTGFEVRMFKIDHDHGGTVDDDGSHTPTINADGDHTHQVQGTGYVSLDTNYGRLVMSNLTDWEAAHTHTGGISGPGSLHSHTVPLSTYITYSTTVGYVPTQKAVTSEDAHTHTGGTSGPGSLHSHTVPLSTYITYSTTVGYVPTQKAVTTENVHTHTNPPTGLQNQGHTHTVPATDGPDRVASAIWSLNFGTPCATGACVTTVEEDDYAYHDHTHTNTGKLTGGISQGHTHTQGITGPGIAHGHDIVSHSTAQSYVRGLTVSQATTSQEGGVGAHTHSYGTSGAGTAHGHDIVSHSTAQSYVRGMTITLATSSDEGGVGAHTHSYGTSGAGTQHRHLISNDTLYNHYVYDVGLTLTLCASQKEAPFHAHSGDYINPHGHGVPTDGRVLLTNTNVTITYLAQEEE